MKILFHSNNMSERGTEVALYDYALGNRNILGNQSYIAVPKDNIRDTNVLKKFENEFVVCKYESVQALHSFISANNIDLVYKIVQGDLEEVITGDVPYFIHCVFSTKRRQGTFYCPISEYLNKWFRTKYPSLPHIVKKFPGSTMTLREDLGIPQNALVFGGYGGEDRFNIPFVHQAIREVARERKDVYFIFLNFKPFVQKENYANIIFLPRNIDREYKETFINTCDAMIHGRSDGEIFSLAVAEFSIKNKPVITWAPDVVHNFMFSLEELLRWILGRHPRYYKGHLYYLGDKAIKYTSKRDLKDILCNFREKYLREINYDCFSEQFSEEKVMRIFNDIIMGKTGQ